MNLYRPTAVAAGVFFLLTEVGAIAGVILYRPIRNVADYITGAGPDGSILLGLLFELLLVIAAVGTAVTLYPILKRQHEGLAMAFVAARVLEAAVILVGTLSLLTIVSLRQQFAGTIAADPATLSTIGSALVALRDWTYLFGPNFALGAASLFLAWLMYSSRLVPRGIAVLGLVGGALISLSAIAVMLGFYGQFSTLGLVVALPVFAWELSLAGWLIVKGVQPVSILDAPPTPVPQPHGKGRASEGDMKTTRTVAIIGAGYAGVLAANRPHASLTGPEHLSVSTVRVNPRAVFIDQIRLHQLAADTTDAATIPLDHPGRRLLPFGGYTRWSSRGARTGSPTRTGQSDSCRRRRGNWRGSAIGTCGRKP